jgi:hypothetical protein
MGRNRGRLKTAAKTDERLQQLMHRNNDGLLTPGELAELESLVELSERLSLVRAEAGQLLRNSIESNGSTTSESLSPDEWIEQFHQWSRRPRIGNPNVDDSRDSIYEGRGE